MRIFVFHNRIRTLYFPFKPLALPHSPGFFSFVFCSTFFSSWTKTLSVLQVTAASGAVPLSILTLWKLPACRQKLRGSQRRKHSRPAARSSKPHLPRVIAARQLQRTYPSKATLSFQKYRSFTTQTQTVQYRALMALPFNTGTPSVKLDSGPRGMAQDNTPR